MGSYNIFEYYSGSFAKRLTWFFFSSHFYSILEMANQTTIQMGRAKGGRLSGMAENSKEKQNETNRHRTSNRMPKVSRRMRCIMREIWIKKYAKWSSNRYRTLMDWMKLDFMTYFLSIGLHLRVYAVQQPCLLLKCCSPETTFTRITFTMFHNVWHQ